MPDQTTTTRGGLFTAGRECVPVPLAGVAIDAEIHGFFARVVVAQRYVNRETQPIEATYVFPLDEGAAVCGFEAVIDGTLVVGEVRERLPRVKGTAEAGRRKALDWPGDELVGLNATAAVDLAAAVGVLEIRG